MSRPPKYIKDYVKKFFGQVVFEKTVTHTWWQFFSKTIYPKNLKFLLHDLLFILQGLTFPVFRNTFSNFSKVNNKNLRVSVKQSASIRPNLPLTPSLLLAGLSHTKHLTLMAKWTSSIKIPSFSYIFNAVTNFSKYLFNNVGLLTPLYTAITKGS